MCGAIILGGHVQALGIVRIMGQRGVSAVVIDSTRYSLARRSKFCKAFYRVKDEDLEEFLLGSFCSNEYKGWTIFPTNDFHVRLLSVNRDKLQQIYIVSTDRWEVTETFYNKTKTYRLAEKTGIPIPDTYFPSDITDLDGKDFIYPCIIKPAVMVDFYRKVKKKVFLCRNEEELSKNYREALKVIPAEEIIIQEVVPGDSRNQFSACFLFLDGHSYARLTACRMRQHPLDFGNATTYAEVTEAPGLLEYGEKLLEAAGYNGVCEVEFKFDQRDGQYKLLEVNPRTWKWHSIAEKAGTPFLPLYFDHLSGKTISPVEGYKHVSFCHATTDIPVRMALLARGQRHWKRVLRPVQHAVWNRSDPAPWFFEKLFLFSYVMSR
jgi:D-aspartate ligase